jgi:predicted ATP-grasp superfamily ATP-dependent carboligase
LGPRASRLKLDVEPLLEDAAAIENELVRLREQFQKAMAADHEEGRAMPMFQ